MARDIAVQMCDVLDGGEYVGVLNAPNMAATRKAQLTPYVFLGEKIGALQAQLLGQGKVTFSLSFLKILSRFPAICLSTPSVFIHSFV